MKHSLVRQNIIDTASHLFYKQGYNLTGINEIIKEAGVAKATLYNHFKSKDDICIAYLRHLNDNFLQDIGSFSAKKSKGKAQILGLFDFLKKFYNSREFNGCWCIRTAAEIPKDHAHIRDEIHRLKKDFIRLITTLITTNLELKSEVEADKLAQQIYVLYEGAVAESYLHGEQWPIDAAYDISEAILN